MEKNKKIKNYFFGGIFPLLKLHIINYIINWVIKMNKKFKMRFSYFLISGLIGFALELVGFFMWTTEEFAYSKLKSTSDLTYFNTFTRGTYFVLFGALLVGVLAYGFYQASRKEHKLIRISSMCLLCLQALLLIDSIVYLIFAWNNRSSLTTDSVKIFIDVLVSLKNSLMYVSSIAMCVIMFGITRIKDRPISKVAAYINLVTSLLFIVSFTVSFFGALSTPSYELLSKFFGEGVNFYNTSNKYTFVSAYGSMNGLTWHNMIRCFDFAQVASGSISSNDVSFILRGSVYAGITALTYGLSLVGNFIYCSGAMIESFDVSRDNDPLGL